MTGLSPIGYKQGYTGRDAIPQEERACSAYGKRSCLSWKENFPSVERRRSLIAIRTFEKEKAITGDSPAATRDRLRRAYPLHPAVSAPCSASEHIHLSPRDGTIRRECVSVLVA